MPPAVTDQRERQSGSGLVALPIKGTPQIGSLLPLRIGGLLPDRKVFKVPKHHNIQKIRNINDTARNKEVLRK